MKCVQFETGVLKNAETLLEFHCDHGSADFVGLLDLTLASVKDTGANEFVLLSNVTAWAPCEL